VIFLNRYERRWAVLRLNENNNDDNSHFEIEEVNVEIRFWIILGWEKKCRERKIMIFIAKMKNV
jgi:hypothetical protein